MKKKKIKFFSENSAISLQQKKLLYTIRRMLQSHKRAGEPNAIEQARILHQSCMNTSNYCNGNSFIA